MTPSDLKEETYRWFAKWLYPTEVKITRISEGAIHEFIISNNFRDLNQRNTIRLSYRNSLKYLKLDWRESFGTRYFVKPESYHIDVRSFMKDRCESPSDLQEVRIME